MSGTEKEARDDSNHGSIMIEIANGRFNVKRENSGTILVYGDKFQWEIVQGGTLLHALAVEALEVDRLRTRRTLNPVTKIDQIKEGDTLLINDGARSFIAKAKIVKVTENDGTEVIFKVKKNKFFNVGMFLVGNSWVKELHIVISQPEG